MALTKEERYARQRAYQKTPEARAKRIAYDKARYETSEYKAYLKTRQATPEYKEKARVASKKYRSTSEYRAWKRAYRASTPAKNARRNQLLTKNFGISLDEYNLRLQQQNGLCAICLRPERFVMRGVVHSLAVDHCHLTGRVRGLLCRDCNQGLGQFRDNVPNMERAVQYLQT